MEGEEGKLKMAAAYMAALAGTAGSASAQDKPPCGSRRSSPFNEGAGRTAGLAEEAPGYDS